jgi:hypothetical protein
VRGDGEVQYAFINGQVAILVHYCEERTKPNTGDGTHYDQVDGGARIDFRRVEEHEGTNPREGTGGYRILPVSEGGIWRIDLSTRLDSEIPEQRYHHHPNFYNGDVGPRAFDEELSADALGWIERHLRDLPTVLGKRGFPDLELSLDMDQLIKSLPMIRSAIEVSLNP